MNVKNAKASFIKYFTKDAKYAWNERSKALESFTPEEIVHLLTFLDGRDASPILGFMNSCKKAHKILAISDVEECTKLIKVRDVLKT